jgi:hypothetical protein
MGAVDAIKPENLAPDSAEWWREVAQQLGFRLSKLRLTMRLLPSDVRGVLIQVYGEKADCSRDKELAEALTLALRNRIKIDERVRGERAS